MSMSPLLAEADIASFPPMTNDFLFDSNPFYHPHGTLGMQPSPIPPIEAVQGAPTTRLGKRDSLDSSVSEFGTMHIGEKGRSATPPTKRSRREPLPSGRVPGACTRCKRLKVIVFIRVVQKSSAH